MMENKNRKRRGHSRYYLLFLISVLGIAILSWGVYYLLSHLKAFEYNKTLLSGNTSIPDSLFVKVLNPYKGHNLLALPTKKISNDLRKISRVKNVKLSRVLFNTLKLQVEESVPVIFVKSNEGILYPVDGDGTVLANYSVIPQEDLPIVTTLFHDAQLAVSKKLKTADMQRILRLHQRILAEFPDFIHRISEYYTVDNTVYIVELETGTRIIPPEEKLADQLRRYLFVQDNGNIGSHKIVDLRYDNQVVVKAGTE